MDQFGEGGVNDFLLLWVDPWVPITFWKVFFRPYRHIERKKSKKKLFQKVDGSRWIHPYIYIHQIRNNLYIDVALFFSQTTK